MRIKFLKPWRVYKAGQIIDPAAVGIGRGPVNELVHRGVAEYEGTETVAGYQTMAMQPVQTMAKKRGRPPGSKNKPKVL